MYYLPEIMAYLASCSRKAPVLIHLICVGHVLHTLNQVCHVPRDVSQRRKSGKFHLPCILQPRLEQETVPAKNPLIHQKMGHSTSMLGQYPIMSRTSPLTALPRSCVSEATLFGPGLSFLVPALKLTIEAVRCSEIPYEWMQKLMQIYANLCKCIEDIEYR